MNEKHMKYLGIAIFIMFVMPISSVTGSLSNIVLENHSDTVGNEYKGRLRIAVVEIESRWRMADHKPFHYGFLEYAFDDDITIQYLDTYRNTISWSGDVNKNNVMVIAAVYNSEKHTAYAVPPASRPFEAHYVDAVAAAKPGETGSNTVNDQFTHTVLCEIGSLSTCPHCSELAPIIEAIFESGDYPFYYIEFVVDKNPKANQRMHDYNLYYVPDAFYDGGKEVLLGSGYDKATHERAIKNCGKRDVHDLDMNLSVNWIGKGSLEITVDITNKEAIKNNPPNIPTITGPTEGKVGVEQSYTIVTTDPDGDNVYYYIDWGDNTSSGWLGPYSSGESITANHTWNDRGYYIIKVKAKDDPDGDESDWQWLKVSMPYNMQMYHILKHFSWRNLIPLLKLFI